MRTTPMASSRQTCKRFSSCYILTRHWRHTMSLKLFWCLKSFMSNHHQYQCVKAWASPEVFLRIRRLTKSQRKVRFGEVAARVFLRHVRLNVGARPHDVKREGQSLFVILKIKRFRFSMIFLCTSHATLRQR